MSRRATADLLYSVPWGFEEDDVNLVKEDTGQQSKARGQYGNNFHRRYKLAIGAEVGRNEGDPDNKEDEHAEGDKLSFRKVLGQFPGFKRKEETNGCQQARVANQEPQSHHRPLIASDKNDLINVMVPVAGGRCVIEPDHTYHHLHKSAQENQKELQI